MKRRLRKWVIPTLSTTGIIMAGSILGYQVVSNNTYRVDREYVTNAIIEDTKQVINEEKETFEKPFNDESVTLSKSFYDKNDSEDQQEKSLIFYENIYMQNTGSLYSSDKEFEVLSVLDGEIKNIKEDDLLGYIVEIKNNEDITTIYQSVSNINLSVGDKVTKGQIIATSGNNALSNEKDNCLLFEYS